jgi:hypothetical protein
MILVHLVHAIDGWRHPSIVGYHIRYQFLGANLRRRVFGHILRAFDRAEIILGRRSRNDKRWDMISAEQVVGLPGRSCGPTVARPASMTLTGESTGAHWNISKIDKDVGYRCFQGEISRLMSRLAFIRRIKAKSPKNQEHQALNGVGAQELRCHG